MTNTHIVVNDIGLAYELVDNCAAFRGFEIDGDTFLATMDAEWSRVDGVIAAVHGFIC